jgi:ubiquitin-conjugating enzyme E2 variant
MTAACAHDTSPHSAIRPAGAVPLLAQGGLSEPRIWSMTLVAGDAYPTAPPTIKFTSKINADFVDARGNVLPAKVPYLGAWNSSKSMYGALLEIKNLIYRAPRSQPPEEATY